MGDSYCFNQAVASAIGQVPLTDEQALLIARRLPAIQHPDARDASSLARALAHKTTSSLVLAHLCSVSRDPSVLAGALANQSWSVPDALVAARRSGGYGPLTAVALRQDCPDALAESLLAETGSSKANTARLSSMFYACFSSDSARTTYCVAHPQAVAVLAAQVNTSALSQMSWAPDSPAQAVAVRRLPTLLSPDSVYAFMNLAHVPLTPEWVDAVLAHAGDHLLLARAFVADMSLLDEYTVVPGETSTTELAFIVDALRTHRTDEASATFVAAFAELASLPASRLHQSDLVDIADAVYDLEGRPSHPGDSGHTLFAQTLVGYYLALDARLEPLAASLWSQTALTFQGIVDAVAALGGPRIVVDDICEYWYQESQEPF